MPRKPFVTNIEKQTLKNKFFRKTLFTSNNCQLVVMSLLPLEEIDLEKHDYVDQFIRIEKGVVSIFVGKGKSVTKYNLKDGDCIVIPQETWHRVKNTSKKNRAFIYTIYSPPNHIAKTIHKNKLEAQKDLKDENFKTKICK